MEALIVGEMAHNVDILLLAPLRRGAKGRD